VLFRSEDKTGLGGSPTAELAYPELRIPADRLLGAVGQGGAVMFAGVGMTRVSIAAQALGIAKRAFDAAVDFALQRVQGGQLIIEHDAVQQRFVDMALMISAIENLICSAARLEERGEWHVRETSIVKYYASEALQELTLRAINVFGGYGVSRQNVVERCRREAVALPLFGGTSEIQWQIIARELLECVDGVAHVDYRRRDDGLMAELAARCAPAPALATLCARAAEALRRLWLAAAEVAAAADRVPYQRHLAELACACAVAQGLLWQASAATASELEHELAVVAVDRLEDRAAVACSRIAGGVTRRALKRTLRALL
jgi:hypothetical protein